MKNRVSKFGVLLFSAAVLLLSSCKKDDGEHHDEEVITTLRLTFTPVGGGAAVTFQYDDPDGPGGANPTKDEIVLAPNKSYTVVAQFLNKTENPVADLTAEIITEGQSHRIYYTPSAGSNITVSGLSTDTNGLPLGITSTWTTGAAATGTMKVTLRHYAGNPPNKAENDPVNSTKSSTDLEVDFNTRIQ